MTYNLDDSMMSRSRPVSEGFPGQRMLVVPHSLVATALRAPGTAHITVTDCGFFPDATHHWRARSTPIQQAVVIVCVEGHGFCETEHGRFSIGPGQTIVLPPSTPHRYWADEDDPWTVWWMHVDGRDLREFLDSAHMTSNSPVRAVGDLYRIVALMREIVESTERDLTESSLLVASGAAWHLLTLLATTRPPSDARGAALERVAEYLRNNLDGQTSVPELAESAHLSTSHFAALFKRRFGMSVVQYQIHQRMAQARELLDLTERPIAHIAKEVGYPDPFYFSRTFTRVHGVMPSAYRSRLR